MDKNYIHIEEDETKLNIRMHGDTDELLWLMVMGLQSIYEQRLDENGVSVDRYMKGLKEALVENMKKEALG